MILYFKNTDKGLEQIPRIDDAQEAAMCGGNFIVIDLLGQVAETNGIPAKSLVGWDRSIGYEPKVKNVFVERFPFQWQDGAWQLMTAAISIHE